jgi:hypothetical protein
MSKRYRADEGKGSDSSYPRYPKWYMHLLFVEDGKSKYADDSNVDGVKNCLVNERFWSPEDKGYKLELKTFIFMSQIDRDTAYRAMDACIRSIPHDEYKYVQHYRGVWKSPEDEAKDKEIA